MGSSNIMDYFKIMILVQILFSFGITGFTYSLPSDTLDYVTGFSDVSGKIDLNSVSGELEGSLSSQKNIPIIEIGALVFYSGNILIDLLVNFMFAIPEMIGLVINGVCIMLNVDSYIFALVQIFASVAISVAYILGLIQLITGIRSGQGIT